MADGTCPRKKKVAGLLIFGALLATACVPMAPGYVPASPYRLVFMGNLPESNQAVIDSSERWDRATGQDFFQNAGSPILIGFDNTWPCRTSWSAPAVTIPPQQSPMPVEFTGYKGVVFLCDNSLLACDALVDHELGHILGLGHKSGGVMEPDPNIILADCNRQISAAETISVLAYNLTDQ